MGVRQSMTMRATIDRKSSSGTNDYNQPIESWGEVAADIACLMWSDTGQETQTKNDSIVVLRETRTRAMFPLGTDVQKGDRLSTVTDRQGNEIFGEHYVYGSPMRRRDHVEVMLREYE